MLKTDCEIDDTMNRNCGPYSAECKKLELLVYRLPEDASAQQPLIERAEEDLLCATSLYRRGAYGYSPLVTVCFLLYQALEKWLKVFIAVQGIPVSTKTHDFYSRFEAAKKEEPAFGCIQSKV
jgi:hypothetical protein